MGEIAYRAYAESQIELESCEVEPWDELSENEQASWQAAADAVIEEANGMQ